MIKAAFYDTKPYDRQYFEAVHPGADLKWQFHEFRLSRDSVSTAEGAQAICIFVNDCANAGILRTLAEQGIKLIALRCAGFNNVDLPAARSLGIRVVRVPAYSPHAVAEHAVGLLLTLNRKIHRAYNRVREQNFALNGLVGFDIAGKTVGIIGTGKIGKLAAQIFRGFDARVLAFDPQPDANWAAARNVTYGPMEQLLRESDILSLHLPLLPETLHLFNAETFARMKRGVYIVNTSRGKLIDTRALIDALKSGRIGGVALDVYEEEEGIFFEDLSGQVLLDDDLSRLLTFPNVLITSHQAFLTHEALTEIARVTTQNLLRLPKGEPALAGTEL